MRATRFTHPAAVDAWDHWFRWREADRLRDRTIDATWARVANALASTGESQARWARRYMDAFCHWQILPDERLLVNAGTSELVTGLESPCAQINLAGFVTAPGTREARFDDEQFLETAWLSVRLLDDALLLAHGCLPPAASLRVGLLGFADAVAQLGHTYGDPSSQQFAQHVGALLDRGTLQGMLDLTVERGGGKRPSQQRLRRLRERGSPGPLLDLLACRGQRHAGLTAIEPHPRLAMLANAASDALEPRPETAAPPGRPLPAMRGDTAAAAWEAAREAIKAAIAPWIDVPVV